MEKCSIKDRCQSMGSTADSLYSSSSKTIIKSPQQLIITYRNPHVSKNPKLYGRLSRRNIKITEDIQRLQAEIAILQRKLQDSFESDTSSFFEEGCKANHMPNPAFVHKEAFDLITPRLKFSPNTHPSQHRRINSQPIL